MSDVSLHELPEQAATTQQPPGELLAQARETKGLTRVEVSELLGLTVSVIRDIELSRFERFPNGVYARGYLKNYSKLVEADQSEVMSAYNRHGELHAIPDDSPFGSGHSHIESHAVARRRNIVIVSASVVVLTLVLILALS